MAVKEIYIDGINLGYATKAEVSPDITDAEETKTFDGPILDVPESVSWEVSIDKVRYDKTVASYREIERLLLSMFTEKKTVKVRETSKLPDGDLIVTSVVYNCVLTDKKYSIDPESRTVENLSFKGSPMAEWVNGKQIAKI